MVANAIVAFDSVSKAMLHGHDSYIQFALPAQMERAVVRSYRSCRRKKARTDELTVSGQFTCSLCDHREFLGSITCLVTQLV